MFSQTATLVITESGSSPTGFDPSTGAPLFGSSETLIAVSIEDTKPPTTETLPGLENVLAYIEGRCLESLPEGVTVPARAQIELELSGQVKRLQFYSVPQTISRLGLDKIFGQPIAGYLIDV